MKIFEDRRFLRLGDWWFAAEKTVEWLPIFTDSVIWIFGFSPFFPSIFKVLFSSHFLPSFRGKCAYDGTIFRFPPKKKKSHINPWLSGYYTDSSSPQFHSAHLFCCLQSDSIGGCVPLKVCLSRRLEFRWPKIDQKSDFQHYCPCHATIQPLSTQATYITAPAMHAHHQTTTVGTIMRVVEGPNNLAPPLSVQSLWCMHSSYSFVSFLLFLFVVNFHSINSVFFNGKKEEGNRLKRRKNKNKAGYTATQVACGWAGAVMK